MDYNKKIFSEDDIRYLNVECRKNRNKTPNHIPVLVQINSESIVLKKHKYLVSNDILLEHFINSVTKTLENYKGEKLIFSVINTTNPLISQKLRDTTDNMRQLYRAYKDINTGFLIIRITKDTYYKRLLKMLRIS